MAKDVKGRKVVSIPPEMWQEFSALARVRNDSVAALVREVLAAYLDENRRGVEAALSFEKSYQTSLFEFREKNSVN